MMKKSNLFSNLLDIKKYQYNIILVFLLSVITILVLFKVSFAYYLYIFMMGFISSYLLIRKTQFEHIIYLLLLSFLVGSGILIILSGIIATIFIPIRPWLEIIPVLLLLVLLYKIPVQISNICFKFDISSLTLLGIAILSMVSHVISIYSFEAPILHDPMSHATWAKQIVETGMVSFFYSPGLHILAALGEMSGSFNVSKQILLLTNIFNSLSFVPVFLFIQGYFNKKWFAIISSSLFVFALYPSKFFWDSGKNSLVTAIPFLFLLLFFATSKIRTAVKAIICNSCLLILIFIHYPAAAVGFIGIVIISYFEEGWFKGLLNYIPGTILGILYGIEKVGYKYEVSNNLGKDIYIVGLFGLLIMFLIVIKNKKYLIISILLSAIVLSMYIIHINPYIIVNNINNTNISLSEFIDFSKSVFLQQMPHFVGKDIYIVGLFGLLIMFLIGIKNKKYLIISILLSAIVLSMYIIHISPYRALDIIISDQILLAFCAIYIGIGFLIGEILIPYLISYDKRFSLLTIFILFSLAIYFSFTTFNQYRTQQTEKNVIGQEDIAVFNWINSNLSPAQKIINNAIKSGNPIFPTDGGGWLEAFTNQFIAMPFTNAWSSSTKENLRYYNMLKTDPASCEARNYFTSQGFKYYFHGSSPIYGPSIVVPQDLLNNGTYKLLYQNGAAIIYQISDCPT